MTSNKAKGNSAEKSASDYFEQNGFIVLEKNYRYKRSEIDLIVRNQEIVIFVEVKYRSSDKFGHPEDFVTPNQQTKIIEAAEHYIQQSNWNGNIRFDIIAIDIQEKIEHFEDAFY